MRASVGGKWINRRQGLHASGALVAGLIVCLNPAKAEAQAVAAIQAAASVMVVDTAQFGVLQEIRRREQPRVGAGALVAVRVEEVDPTPGAGEALPRRRITLNYLRN